MSHVPTKELNIITKAAHYNSGKYEPIDIMLDCKMGGCLFTVVKYISRAGKKGGQEKYLEDLKKARYYLEKEIWQQSHDHEEYDKTRPCTVANAQDLAIDWGLNAALGFALQDIMNSFAHTNHSIKLDYFRKALLYLTNEIEKVEDFQKERPRNFETIIQDANQ